MAEAKKPHQYIEALKKHESYSIGLLNFIFSFANAFGELERMVTFSTEMLIALDIGT
jgi:hypothetical protein